MSSDPNAPEPYRAPMPPSGGRGTSVWLYLGIGCLCVVFLCCGGGSLVSYIYFKKTFTMTQDAAEVAQKGSEIADFDVPAGFKPEMAFSMKNPVSGQAMMTIVAYQGPNREGGIFLMSMGEMMGDATQLRQQMDIQMQAQGRQAKHMRVLETRDVELEIRGQPATFHIQQAEDPQNKQKYVQAEGAFAGKQGTSMIVAQLKADNFSEEDAEKLVRSIK